MIRLSEHTASLTSAWILTGNKKYSDKVIEHLVAWFVTPETKMNPHMLYVQAISDRVTGRGIGLIDAYHLVEVVQSLEVLSKEGAIPQKQTEKIKAWFEEFLEWMTTHPYGIEEMETSNNHSVCWLATASIIAKLTDNKKIINFCIDRFKNVTLLNQMAADGSFPLEFKRTKPYGYSLFNMDAFANVAWILSTSDNNLWEYSTTDGKSFPIDILPFLSANTDCVFLISFAKGGFDFWK